MSSGRREKRGAGFYESLAGASYMDILIGANRAPPASSIFGSTQNGGVCIMTAVLALKHYSFDIVISLYNNPPLFGFN